MHFGASFGSTTSSATGERLYLTGNTYLGYNNNNGTWFDINHPNSVTSTNIPANTWTLVTYVFTESGITLYINGEAKANESYAGSADADAFDYSKVLDWMSSANYFYLGMGSFGGSAPAMFDDLLIYNRALTEEDIAGLTVMANRDFNFATGHYPTVIYDLSELRPVLIVSRRALYQSGDVFVSTSDTKTSRTPHSSKSHRLASRRSICHFSRR